MSSPSDRSKLFTLFTLPGRPVHFNTNSASSGSMLAMPRLSPAVGYDSTAQGNKATGWFRGSSGWLRSSNLSARYSISVLGAWQIIISISRFICNNLFRFIHLTPSAECFFSIICKILYLYNYSDFLRLK